jgi:tRNA pseudouridine55 synthase
VAKRDIDGLLILDKAPGLTSNKCLQQVKQLLGAAKAGHTGSLDPLASGVLPLCFGEATKVSQFLLDSDKQYHARIRLGITTTTGDSEGEVLATADVPTFTQADIERVLAQFTGVITQLPPAYSALKQDGVPQYKLARAGLTIVPKYRDITIHALRLLNWTSPDLEVEVGCSKGTYIRTLAEDIGKALSTGAHLTMLRRTKAGPFTLHDSHTLEQLQALQQGQLLESVLIPMDQAISEMPALTISEEQTLCLRQGKHVLVGDVPAAPQIRIYCNDTFIGVAELRPDHMLKATRLLKY